MKEINHNHIIINLFMSNGFNLFTSGFLPLPLLQIVMLQFLLMPCKTFAKSMRFLFTLAPVFSIRKVTFLQAFVLGVTACPANARVKFVFLVRGRGGAGGAW